MPRTLSPPTRLEVAQHEIAHAAYGTAIGATVDSITLTPKPAVSLCFPTDLLGLRGRWRVSPTEALRDVIHACGVYLAPYALSHERLRDSDDLYQLQRWQRAWTALEPIRGQDPPVAWEQIVRLAWCDVEHWGGHPGAAAALASLASRVACLRFCSGHRWRELWHSRAARPLWSEITGG